MKYFAWQCGIWGALIGMVLVVSACGGGEPSNQIAQNPSPIAQNPSNSDTFYFNEEPVIAVVPQISEESFHVEYPTVYRVGRGFAMLYSAIGDGFRWRIKLAYSSDGVNWVRWGNIFDERVLPFDRRYAFPYVTVNSSGVFEAYFAVEPSGGVTYTELWKATSSDGFLWSEPQLQFSDNMVLDPVVLDSGRRILYTSRNNLNKDVVKQRVLGAQGWGPVQVVYDPPSGIYTLGNLLYRGKNIIVVHSGQYWRAKCFDSSGMLVDAAAAPILTSLLSGTKWDAYRYGPSFFMRSDGGYNVYYNGIAGYRQELYGEIGVAFIGSTWFDDKLSIGSCAY